MEKIRRKFLLKLLQVLIIKTHEIAQKLDLAQRTVEKLIAQLKKEGVLKRIGSDRMGYWAVKDAEEDNKN